MSALRLWAAWQTMVMIAPLVGAAHGAPLQAPVAQAPAWQVQSFREDAGLTERSVFFIDFAPDGTGWFAASDGLYRYDGYSWRRFTTDGGLPSDHVRSVLVASTGKLWVGTDRGAGVFDGKAFRAVSQLAGPSVRRIVETSDGAVWFCCDRWPDADVPSGLTRFSDGAWTTWRTADGLPSNYVSDLFESSTGRLFVLTDQGLAELVEGAFQLPLRHAGLHESGSYVWSMVESERHGLLVATEAAFYQHKNGRWRSISNSLPALYLPKLTVTADDRILACTSGAQPQFLAFDGEGFSPVTEPFPALSGSVEALVEDRLGGVWAAGFNFLVRWERSDPQWQPYEDLGLPVLRDDAGGVWFERADDAFLRVFGADATLVEGSSPIVRGADGAVWLSAGRDVLMWRDGERVLHTAAGLALESLEPRCIGPQGRLWASGRRGNGASAVLSYDGREWSSVALPDERPESFVSITPDPRSGIWCIVSGLGSVHHRLYRVDTHEVTEVALPKSSQLASRPSLLVDSNERRWLYGFFGLLLDDGEGAGWQAIELGSRSVRQAIETGDEIWFACRGHLGSGGALARSRDLDFQIFSGLNGTFLFEDVDGTTLFAAASRVTLIRPGMDGPPAFATCPTDGPIQGGVRDPEGRLWLSSGGVTLRWRTTSPVPQACIVKADDVLQSGEPLELHAGLRKYYEPGVHYGGTVSSRLDGGPWSPWAELSRPTLASQLGVGDHLVEVHVRDPFDRTSPTPAALPFQVLPIPLQRRAWFAPVVAGLFVALAALASLAIVASTKLSEQARLLECTVDQRTEQLRASERRFRTLFEESCDAVLLFDLDGSLQVANKAAHDLLAPDGALLPRSIAEIFTNDDEARRFQRSSSELDSIRGKRYRIRSVTGRQVDVLLSANLWHDEESGHECWQLILHDITHQAQLEERLQHTQKMEALGRMASGIAHDFNNILTVILGFGQSVRTSLRANESLSADVERILKAARRAQALTAQIQAFGRGGATDPRVIDVYASLHDIAAFVREIVSSNVALNVDVAEAVGHVKIDPSQLAQLVMNLAVNASQAMPAGGQITIAARNVGAARRSPPPSEPGDCVLLEVTDTGCGMSSETRLRACEPFYTTKPVGEGTGLGLAIVYGIVQQAGGAIEVESAPNEGTRVRVYLPRCEEPLSAIAEEPADVLGTRGTEMILVVDDEESIRNLIQGALERAGYAVATASSAHEALALLEDQHAVFDLVLTDIVMPEMSGTQLVRQLRDLAPRLPVMVMSGYPRPDADDGVLADLGVPFVSKPFFPDTLLVRIRQTLESGTRSTERHTA